MNFATNRLEVMAGVLWTLFVLSCGRSHNGGTGLKGWNEEDASNSYEQFRGKQRVPPEWAPVEAIIISSTLVENFRETAEPIVRETLNAGASQIWMGVNLDPLAEGDFQRTLSVNLLNQWAGANFTKRTRLVAVATNDMYEGLSTWARDWAPLTAVSSDGDPRIRRLIDFNYYPDRRYDDAFPSLLQKETQWDRVAAPLRLEGGNFMINSRGECMTTKTVLKTNSQSWRKQYGVTKDDIKSGKWPSEDNVLSPAQIEEYLKEAAGCTDVLFLEAMPWEGTGHIDMWAKFLNDDTVLVAQMQADTLATIPKGTTANRVASEIQKFLDKQALILAGRQYKVVRVPLPAPNVDPAIEPDPIRRWFRSYTNSLLINGVALVPIYSESKIGRQFPERLYTDQSLLSTYDANVRKAYESAGYRVVTVPSDGIIVDGGTVHCATMQVPKLVDAKDETNRE